MTDLKSASRRIYTKGVWQMTPAGMEFLPAESEFFDYTGPVADAAAGAWKIYTRAKRSIGAGGGTITLGAGVFKMCLHRTSASANILKVSNGGISTFASVGSEISATGGYAANGRNIPPATGKWTVGASTKQMKFSYTTAGLVFTANGANLTNIRYAVIRNSTGAGAGKVLCFCTLSTAAFTITSPNTLTISPAATGIFTLA
jgi:hypothetical protein